MKHTEGDQSHMWLIGGAVVAALLLGWGVGWALAIALVACGAMFAAVFWIGRSTARQVSTAPADQEQGLGSR